MYTVLIVLRACPMLLCRIVGAAFANDKTFQNALNAAFEHFINLSPRAPEYISLFMDDQLRRVRAHQGFYSKARTGLVERVCAPPCSQMLGKAACVRFDTLCKPPSCYQDGVLRSVQFTCALPHFRSAHLAGNPVC
jgi:hypothetical protein